MCLIAAVTQGCKSISTSFAFDQKILIKVPYTGEPAEKSSANGWRFKPIVTSSPSRLQPQMAEWYLAWPPEDPRYTLSRHDSRWAWKQLRRITPELVDVVHATFGEYPMVIEPNLVFGKDALAPPVIKKTLEEKPSVPEVPPDVVANEGPSKVWPIPKNAAGQVKPLWHLGDEYSQLRSARMIVESNNTALNGVIRIGILDCGFDSSHLAMPENIEDDPAANAINILHCPYDPSPIPPGSTGTPHGTGTLGILAGRKVHLCSLARAGPTEAVEDYLGGAPHATIVPVLVAPWVFSVQTADLAYGIDYASRVKHCDVISMSHGGAPTLIWADAVNSAYERGTAIFAATGDFYDWIGTDMGILVPSTTVYPAAFRTVMGVTGVTASGKTYAKNGIWNLVMHLFSVRAWQQYLARGSYGADLESRWLFGYMSDPDEAQVWDNGLLHPYPIAAYSPNIPWPVSSTAVSSKAKNLIDLDGSGTSAATPQVAAAAALWLQQNYNEITSSNDWHSWKKAEAVYVALLASAKRAKRGKPDHYLGAGILKARDALTNDYANIRAMEDTRANRTQNQKAGVKPILGFSQSPRDYYDGQRTGAQLLMPWRRQPAFVNRADLRQMPKDFATPELALKNVYFNGILLEKYEWARIPKKGRQERRLDACADKLARQTISVPGSN